MFSAGLDIKMKAELLIIAEPALKRAAVGALKFAVAQAERGFALAGEQSLVTDGWKWALRPLGKADAAAVAQSYLRLSAPKPVHLALPVCRAAGARGPEPQPCREMRLPPFYNTKPTLVKATTPPADLTGSLAMPPQWDRGAAGDDQGRGAGGGRGRRR